MGELALLTARSPDTFADGPSHNMFLDARFMCVSTFISSEFDEQDRFLTGNIDHCGYYRSTEYHSKQPGLENDPLVKEVENAQRPVD